MGFFVILIFAAVIATIFIPLRVRTCASLCRGGARVSVTVCIFKLISIRVRLKRKAKGAKHTVKDGSIRAAVHIFSERKRFLYLDLLRISGNIGIGGDAAATAVMCAASNELLINLTRWLFGKGKHISISIMPEFRFASAWVYMECIIKINLAKLMCIIGKEVIGYVTSHRKHNAKHHGTVKANG